MRISLPIIYLLTNILFISAITFQTYDKTIGRYTHKIAISNHRISSIENDSVTFRAKDYKKGGKNHFITLSDTEFIRRFSLHILPKGFTRIRHYGILSSSLKKVALKIIEEQIGEVEFLKKEYIRDQRQSLGEICS